MQTNKTIYILQKPVVITNSNLVSSAQKWTLDYLEHHMGSGDYTVFVSRNHKFKYYDEKKMAQKNSKGELTGGGVEFTPPTKKVEMKLPEFMRRLREWKKGDERFVFVYLCLRICSTWIEHYSS